MLQCVSHLCMQTPAPTPLQSRPPMSVTHFEGGSQLQLQGCPLAQQGLQLTSPFASAIMKPLPPAATPVGTCHHHQGWQPGQVPGRCSRARVWACAVCQGAREAAGDRHLEGVLGGHAPSLRRTGLHADRDSPAVGASADLMPVAAQQSTGACLQLAAARLTASMVGMQLRQPR